MFLNSDQLYVPALVDDLLHRSGSLRDWFLTPSPYFFPDALLYAALRETGASIEWASYGAGALQYLAIAFASRRLLVRGLRWSEANANSIGPLFPLLIWSYPQLQFVESLVRITRHGFAVWMSLMTLELCLRAPEPKVRRWTALSIAFSVVSAMSDPLYTVTCAAPLAALALFQAARARSGAGAVAPTLLVGRSLGSAAGAVVGMFALQLAFPATTAAHTEVHVDQVWQTLARLGADLPGTLRNDALLGLLIVGACAVVLVGLRRRAEDARLRTLASWCLLSLGISVGALLGSAHYMDYHSLRYVIVPWAIGAVLIAAVAARLARGLTRARAQPRWARVGAALMLAALASLLILRGPAIVRGSYAAELRGPAACIENIARREGSDFVLAEYWYAKPLQSLSPHQLRVVQVELAPVRPRLWINSRAWYRGLDSLQWSVLVANGFAPDQLDRFGKAARVEQCERLEVRTYKGKPRRRVLRELHANLFSVN